jgi:glycosyltransferase involved in cell wall biosynthesis
MKVAQVCHRYHPTIGGVQTYVKGLSESLVKRGAEVEVLTTDVTGAFPREEVVNGVRIRRFKSWAPNGAYNFSRDLQRYIADKFISYDIVHSHNYWSAPALYAALAKGNGKLVFNPHYYDFGDGFVRNLLRRPYRFYVKGVFAQADWIVCVSQFEKDLLLKRFRIDANRIAVIPCGTHLEEFLAARTTKKNNSSVVLYTGRLRKFKGIEYLIRVLPLLSDKINVEIIGEGPYKETLLKLARKLGVNDRVRIHDFLDHEELPPRYADAGVFVSLSKGECYGMSVAEALAAGTPCIVSTNSALREWVDNENCLGADYPIKVVDLAALIEKLIGKKVKALDYGKIQDWREVTDKVCALYRLLMDDVPDRRTAASI